MRVQKRALLFEPTQQQKCIKCSRQTNVLQSVTMISRTAIFALLVATGLSLSSSRIQRSHALIQHNWEQMYHPRQQAAATEGEIPCTCGVFLESQTESRGAALRSGEELHSIFSYPIGSMIEEEIPDGVKGRKICTKKCVDEALKLMHSGPQLLCSLGRDITNERIHLFIKNKEDKWYPTKLNSGRTFTCRDGQVVA